MNTNFLKEWQPFDKVEKQVQLSLLNYFKRNKCAFISEHGAAPKNFYPNSFSQIDNLLGLAYTSTSSYAALWCCNSGYLMATPTHHFIGFAVNVDGEVIGIAEDGNDNDVFINMDIQTNKLQRDLQRCTVVGNYIFLPDIKTGMLEDYAGLKKAIQNAGGVYKNNGFLFPSDAQPYFDLLIDGKTNIKKDFQFFETPAEIAQQLVAIADPKQGAKILEPSAGHGAIIKAIQKRYPDLTISYCEFMDINQTIISEIPNTKFLCADFLKLPVSEKFDVIIANPPFTKGQDIAHLRKMYDHLNNSGVLVCVTSTSWLYGNNKKQQQFKQWLGVLDNNPVFPITTQTENGDTVCISKIEANAFKESGTSVETLIVSIKLD